MKAPEVYSYHDHLGFLKDWLAYRKASQSTFSLRNLAKDSRLSPGYLPLVLAGKRTLSLKALAKLGPHLGLNKQERSYFEALVILGTTDSQQVRLEALQKMRRFTSYKRKNPKELEAYQYLTHWYYVAIREMAMLPGFEPTAEWVSARLKFPVPLQEIKTAIEFLSANGYFLNPEKALDCIGGVYKVALTQFHHEVLHLAAESISSTAAMERSIQGHTVALSESQFHRAREILEEALKDIQALTRPMLEDGKDVYHVELALFPMSQKPKK